MKKQNNPTVDKNEQFRVEMRDAVYKLTEKVDLLTKNVELLMEGLGKLEKRLVKETVTDDQKPCVNEEKKAVASPAIPDTTISKNDRMDEGIEFHKDVMILATKEGCLEDLKYLVERCGLPMAARSSDGENLLELGIQSGSREITTYIIQRGSELKLDDKECNKLMLLACKHGDIDVIKYMHLQGVELTVKDDLYFGKMPVHIASEHGHVEMLKYLRLNGADFSVKNRLGETPLHYASIYGQLDAIRFLHKQGVDISVKNIDGRTPLHFASGNLEAVKLLHKLGANAKARDRNEQRPVDIVRGTDSTHRAEIVAYLIPYS